MISLKSRRECCPEGFIYRQSQTGWEMQSWDFEQLCQQLQAHRIANPQYKLSTDMEKIRNEVDNANALRVLRIPGGDIYVNLQGANPPPIPRRLPQLGGAVEDAKKFVANTAAGASLYLDWFGAGGMPVKKELAEQRAAVCVKCPKMVKGNFFQRWNEMSANQIMKVLGILKDLELSTSHDEQLNICDACDCPMKAKVWSPIDVIVNHLRPEAKEELWEECWMRSEPWADVTGTVS